MRITQGLSEGQVLQRRPEGAQARISGICSNKGAVFATVKRGARFLASFSGKKIGLSDGKRFQALLQGLPPGGPYNVLLHCGKESLQIRGVFVGDLWLMAGQSNMEGCGALAGAATPHPQVRCLTMGRRWEMARDPLHFKPESPDPVHGGLGLAGAAAEKARRKAQSGAGLGIHFARLMFQQTRVPQGLIATAQGGSTMQQWDPRLRVRGGDSLYGSMWLSLQAAAQPLAGVLWYQGESEALPALVRTYTQSMLRLIRAVRRDLRQPQLPWLMAQIGRFVKATPSLDWPDADAWNQIQEQQRLLPKHAANCSMVPSIDLELGDPVHLSADAFPRLASRFAQIAAPFVDSTISSAALPEPQAIRFHPAGPGRKPRISIDFTGVAGTLQSTGPIRGFTVLDAARRPLHLVFRAGLERRRAILHLTSAPPRRALLSYGHGLDPLCTLRDSRGMALPVFGPLPILGLPSA